MRPTTSPSANTSKSSSFHWPDGRLSAARFRISWSISAPLPVGRAEHRDCTEGKKHGAKMSRSPAQAETAQNSDRKESKARSRDLASIPAPDQKGQRPGCPCARVDG